MIRYEIAGPRAPSPVSDPGDLHDRPGRARCRRGAVQAAAFGVLVTVFCTIPIALLTMGVYSHFQSPWPPSGKMSLIGLIL